MEIVWRGGLPSDATYRAAVRAVPAGGRRAPDGADAARPGAHSAVPDLRAEPADGRWAQRMGPLLPEPATVAEPARPRVGDRSHHRALRLRLRMGRARRLLRRAGRAHPRAGALDRPRHTIRPMLDESRRGPAGGGGCAARLGDHRRPALAPPGR